MVSWRPPRSSQIRDGIWPSNLRILVFLTIPTHHSEAVCRGFGDATFIVGLHFLGVLIFAATYRFLNQPPFPKLPPDQFDVSGQPFEQKSEQLPTYKDQSPLQDGDRAPANVNPDELAIAKDSAQLENGQPGSTNQSSDLKDAKQNFSYLAYYAYSEVPPETKPADTVLKSLEDIPRGTTVEEIKRVAEAFGMDFNFMKAVAKVESDLNPNQRHWFLYWAISIEQRRILTIRVRRNP